MPLTLPPPVIDADRVMAQSPTPTLVDVRWYLDGRSGLDAYKAGHIPGAIFVDLDRALAAHGSPLLGRHPLPSPEAFATALGAIGIPDDDFVVAYDDTGGGTAARLVWMLRAIGQAAAVLDGGLAAWPGVRDHSTTTLRPPVARTVVEWPARLLTILEDLDGAGEDVHVLDARAPERYRGDVEPIDPRPGHIPGAKSLPWTTLLADDGRLAPKEQLREAFGAVGVTSAEQLVASCGSGVTACMLLVAAEHAGLGTGRLFVPSYSGWSSDPRRRVALGD